MVPGYKGTLPYDGTNYPYPVFVTTKDASDDLAYGLTKAVMEHYADIKEAGPSMDGYQLSSQKLDFIFPYHPAAVSYYKEKGVWTKEHDAHNALLLKRQEVLAAGMEGHAGQVRAG